jgi:hypothetical protein
MSKKLDISESVTPVTPAPHISKSAKELAREKLKELIQEETRLVKGIFQCFESPGATVPISVSKYPGVPMFRKDMVDGCEYEIPLYVARFLNGIDASAGALSEKNKAIQLIGTCSYAVHGFKYQGADLPPSQSGSIPGGPQGIPVPMVAITKRVRRFGFQSMEFGGVAV